MKKTTDVLISGTWFQVAHDNGLAISVKLEGHELVEILSTTVLDEIDRQIQECKE